MVQSLLFEEKPDVAVAGTATVLVPYPVDKAYSYAVPEGLAVAAGDYVTVPLGSREVPGVVWDAPPDDVPSKKIKTVVAKFDMRPMPAVHRKFLDWVAQYNMAPLGFVLKMSLPVPGALDPPKAAKGYVLSATAKEALSPVGRGLGEGQINPFQGKARPKQLTQNARELRQNQTNVEKTLWFNLNNRQMQGYKFRRQYALHPYIADFACPEKKLIVELDGGQHAENQEYDSERTAFFEQNGFKVLRFWNNEVVENLEGVLETISNALVCPSPNPLPTGERAKKADRFLQNLSPQRRKILEVLSDGLPRRASEIADEAGCTPAVVKGLLKYNLIEEVDIHTSAPCRKPDISRAGPALSAAQEKAAQKIVHYIKSNNYHAALLDGVTGAGKTEVYFEGVAEAVKNGRQVLILLPEIALSNAFLERFKSRFGCAPALWHSALSPHQRKNTWRGVAAGETKVIVGARSALFLPFADLGLIVVDEEHDPAYKQEDGVIYNARDMAIVRAHLGRIPIVLVSATPSLETMANIWAERYEQLHLPDRHGAARLPDMHVIDMKKDKPERQHFIAPTLKEAIAANLAANEQSLLFLNRRGYAPLTICRTCGHRISCPRCTAWLVEHRKSNRLHCHHCGFSQQFPKACPSCSDHDSLSACGPGVERILEEVKEYFPQARTVVLASDTAGTQDDLRKILNDIREHQYDIIIGTQIIAKGHHFPNLTLVGVIDADLGLGGGDLRAAERTFQLLHQVAGRAGREELPGHVYLQTFVPGNKVMQALAGHDRDAFLEVEAAEREAAHMPPYSRLAGIIVSGKDERLVMDTAVALGKCAPEGGGLLTLGPAEAPFYRLRGNYRRRFLVRADKKIDLQKVIEGWLAQVKTPSAVRVYTDIDPQSFL